MRRILSLTVPINTAISNEDSLRDDSNFQEMALAGIECPAAVTSATVQVEYSRDGGTVWYSVRPAGTVESISVAAADGNNVRAMIPLTPSYYYGVGQRWRIRCASSEAAARTFNLVFCSVS